ncbi:MAG: sugar transferase [Bacteroidota bacterium]|nr:sugar transferase [Candidatus Kapabacteria bacterium]MDW8220241.1 sugar transferase [Bacteroidota bacterium]
MTETGKRFSFSKAFLLVLDVLTAFLAVYIMFAVRTSETVIAFSRKAGALYKLEAFLFYTGAALLVPVFFRINNLYKYRVIASASDQITQIIKSYVGLGMLLLTLLFFLQDRVLATSARGFWLGFELLGMLLLSIERSVVSYFVRRRKFLRDEVVAKKVLIIGAGHAGETFALRILNDPELGIEQAYFLDDDDTKVGTSLLGFPIVGKTTDVMRAAIDLGADEIYITINAIKRERLLEIIEECKKTKLPIKVFSRHFRIVQDDVDGSVLSGALELPSQITIHPGLIAKRIIDVLVASFLLIVLFIPGLVIALLIRLTSRGPIFYTSYRIGKGGREFKMFKFRTMYLNDEREHREIAEQRLKEGIHMGKPDNDSRITPIGRFLRRYSIDELPQILNVLRGEMSLVGPRPCLAYELQYFEDWHKRRFLVLPGLTGLWQVTGRQIEGLSLHDAMILDVFYAENFTIWLDIKILLKTIPVVLCGKSKV